MVVLGRFMFVWVVMFVVFVFVEKIRWGIGLFGDGGKMGYGFIMF